MSKLAKAMRRVADLYEAHGIDATWAAVGNVGGRVTLDIDTNDFRTMFAGRQVGLYVGVGTTRYSASGVIDGILVRCNYIKLIDFSKPLETTMRLPALEPTA